MKLLGLKRLLAGAIDSLTIWPDGRQEANCAPSGAVLSGSFNPLHRGHRALSAAAAHHCALPALFELPVINADKGPLAANEIARRAAQFSGQHTLVLTHTALFSQKAAIFPASTFVVGFDTAARLLEPRYYGSDAALRAAFAAFQANGCRFLVAGRLADGRFATLADLHLPSGLETLFSALPEAAFRADISSSALRAGALDA